jgi:tetratricopeptide (TPR) repeat protein
MLQRSLRRRWVLLVIGLVVAISCCFAVGIGKTLSQPLSKPEIVFPDYQQRSQIIQSYEEQVHQSPDSFILLRLLAGQYLRRFREVGDVEDLLRAEQAARRSLTIHPRQGGATEMLLASALLSQHRFQEALQVVTEAPQITEVVLLRASILMELGDYETTEQLLTSATISSTESTGQSAIQARYLELTGHLNQARQLLDQRLQQMDSFYTTPAETLAWFHVRAGDLAFAAGDLNQSEWQYRQALIIFPDEVAAYTGLARLYSAQHRWQQALEMANQGSDRVPQVETLAYKADAQRALGDPKGAAATEALIEVVARLSQVQGIYDRALANYYSDHGIHLADALQIAQQEVALRDDIYAEDTLAWAAAANERWQDAQRAIQRATRYGTEDALLHFHHGVIAWHCNDLATALDHLQWALRLNPQFHHRYAAEARQLLAKLRGN